MKGFQKAFYFVVALVTGAALAWLATYIPLTIIGLVIQTLRGDSGPAFGSIGTTELVILFAGFVFVYLWYRFTRWFFSRKMKQFASAQRNQNE